MNKLLLLLYFTWTLRIFANLLSYINLWFIKEYRFDRMFIHLKTKQGKLILFLPFRTPPVSPKTITLFFSGIIYFLISYYLLPFQNVIKIFIIDFFTFPFLSLSVFILKIPTFIYHKIVIHRAMQKLQQHKKMLVIGVTGSYGKTSVKEFLYTILSEKYKVLKTEGSKNSLIGISEVILKYLKPDHEIFIVEMGAYKIGEIENITKLLKPEIGIITAINFQHQDLFKSMENTMKAKYELIKGLVGSKISIMNYDNDYVRKMIEWAKKDKINLIVYTTKKPSLTKTEKNLYATNIETSLNGIEFDMQFEKNRIHAVSPVLGAFQVGNILAACCVALYLKMDLESIRKALLRLKTGKLTMNKKIGINGAIFINDTFNNNPDAVKRAIDYISLSSGRKILVIQPMIELGKFAEQVHLELGNYAAKFCDEIYLTNPNFYKQIKQGACKIKPNMKLSILSYSKIAQKIKDTVKKDDIVLFKGKEAGNVFQLLEKHYV